ncbi:hypothetical protein B2J93_4750 [Marssonina coronariae]|uniref:Uncharacterized protein n=1 Tax=Diplocarpon coronariae TaxID=2795749 RepID=A0A218Z2P4_9HELO|nr:hypothetical protein B2J93_4750 [Marssonina coronariae]
MFSSPYSFSTALAIPTSLPIISESSYRYTTPRTKQAASAISSPNPSFSSANRSDENNTSGTSSEQADYRIVKDGWGGPRNFMESCGRRLHSPQDIQEDKAILDGFGKLNEPVGG